MLTQILKAQSRSLEQKPKHLRKAGIIPGTLYGPKMSPVSIQVEQKQLLNMLKKSHSNQLIDLKLEDQDKTIKVILHHIEKHPVNDTFLNIEFYVVNLEAKVTVDIPIHTKGEAPAVKINKGVLFQSLPSVKIECLPMDILPEIIVDVSSLDNFEKGIFVENLHLPQTIKILNNPKELVVKVLPPKTEEEVVSAVETEAATEPELIGKDKNESSGTTAKTTSPAK